MFNRTELALVDIATSADAGRETLRRITAHNGYIFATDAYRITRTPFDTNGDTRAFSIDAEGLDPNVQTIRDAFDKFGEIIEGRPIGFDLFDRFEPGETYTLQGFSSDRYARNTAKDLLIALEQWSYWDGQRRKPLGIARLEIEGAFLNMFLGLRVADKKRMPRWVGFDPIPIKAPLTEGDNDAEPIDIGHYSTEYLATAFGAGYGQVAITVPAEKVGYRPIMVATADTDTLVMPIRMGVN